MAIGTHLSEFGGKKVVQWEPGQPIADTATTIHRISCEYDDKKSFLEKFEAFLKTDGASKSTGFVVGAWDEPWEESETPKKIAEALATAKDQLPELRALFWADITYEESEISWIGNTDISGVIEAFPQLEHLGIRGGNGLSLGAINHDHLKSLSIQTGGMRKEVVQQVATANLPELEHLELYLGTDEYGANYDLADLSPILSGGRFPKLNYLGLCNAHLANDIAKAVANAPILERIAVLDLSLGTLTDEGGKALLDSPSIRKLNKLDLHHHFMSDEMTARLGTMTNVDASGQQEEDDDWRYVAIGE